MTVESSNSTNRDLTFFSRVSASVSHEIKNVLAIINENAGLLEDLVLMSQNGSPLSPERLSRLADTIQTQIKRADEIVKTMNRFAHSTDHPVDMVNLFDAAVFITGLCKRMLGSNDLKITIIPPESPVRIQSNLFYLQKLIFVCIESILNTKDHLGAIRIEFRNMNPGSEIRFTCEGSPQSHHFVNSVTSKTYSLMTYLKAEVVFDIGTDSFGIQFPENIGELSKV